MTRNGPTGALQPGLSSGGGLGCATTNGLGMLLHQGALAFERWTGLPAPREVMRTTLLASLERS